MSPSIKRRIRNILLLFSRKSLPSQTWAPPSREEEEIFYFSSLENLCPPTHEPLHLQKKKKYHTSFLHLYDSGWILLENVCPPRHEHIHQQNKARNWQIVAQIKLFSDLCDGISLYRQNTRPVYRASCGLFKLIQNRVNNWLVHWLVVGR